jgi:hypothetical protein
VPVSCKRKSLYGWMILFPRARYREDAAVDLASRFGCRDRWHMAHRAADSGEELLAAIVSALIGPRAGAFVERMKFANATMSTPSSSRSGTGSKGVPNPTKTPLEVFSSGNSGLVIPISFR